MKVVLCDGGLCNRLNALIFALILRKRYGHDWRVSWPKNNWCGADFSSLFEYDLPVDDYSIEHYKKNESSYKLLLHENQCQFSENLISYHSSLNGYTDYQEILDGHENVLYFNNLIPRFVSTADIQAGLSGFKIALPIKTAASEFCSERSIDESVLGLHIRKTDFGSTVDDNALYELAAASPLRFFVCSDDADVNRRFSQLPNCCVFEKSSFPEKLIGDVNWQSWTTDNEGRKFPFNITRSEASIAEALIDLLILSRTTLVKTSNSTFLNMAGIFKSTGFF